MSSSNTIVVVIGFDVVDFGEDTNVFATSTQTWDEAIERGEGFFREEAPKFPDVDWSIVVLKQDVPGFVLVAVRDDEQAEQIRAVAEENIICRWTAASFPVD